MKVTCQAHGRGKTDRGEKTLHVRTRAQADSAPSPSLVTCLINVSQATKAL